jgi:hypothetical protein
MLCRTRSSLHELNIIIGIINSKLKPLFFPKLIEIGSIPVFNLNGKAGSQAHIDGVLAVVRRVQIDELTKTIDGLQESWSDLYSNEEKVGHRVE